MFDWFIFQQGAIAFLIAFAMAGAFTLAFKLIYQWITPYHERTLIRQGNQAAAVTLARRLTEIGFSILATRGTAARIREAGLECQVINKVLEGRPHCVDAIKSGEIQLVINTTGGGQSVADSFDIRRSALTHGIPHYTTAAGARAAVHAIAALKAGTLDVAPLQAYFATSF